MTSPYRPREFGIVDRRIKQYVFDPRPKELAQSPFLFRCGEPGCFWGTSHPTLESAERTQQSHICPYGSPVKISEELMGPLTPAFLQQSWATMDSLMLLLYTDDLLASRAMDKKMSVDEVKLDLRAELRGRAAVTALAMPHDAEPPLDTVEAISRELKRRYNEVRNGNKPSTPGVEDAYRPFRPSGAGGTSAAARTVTRPSPRVREVSDEIKASALGALRFGLLADADIMSTYSLSVAQLNEIKKEL